MTKLSLVAPLAVCAFVISAIVVGVVSPAHAEQITLSTAENRIEPGIRNQGWYAVRSGNSTSNVSAYTSNLFRGFFTFLVPPNSHGKQYLSAVFVTRLGDTSSTNEQTETIGLFDVATDAVTLNHNVEANAAIFEDLGTGDSYGEFVIPGKGDTQTLLQLSLNATAVSDINAAAGKYFSIGARLLSSNGGDFVFGNNALAELELNRVPEPSSASLIAIGLIALARRMQVVNADAK